MNRLLAPPLIASRPDRERESRAYVLALSLFVAQRRPTTLLLEHPDELTAQTRALSAAARARGRDLAGAARRGARRSTSAPAGTGDPDPRDRGSRDGSRARCARGWPRLLGTRGFYDLDRLDLGVGEHARRARAGARSAQRVDRFSTPEVAAATGPGRHAPARRRRDRRRAVSA